jgi:hypothetical protein
MKRTRKRAGKNKLLQMLPAAIAVASVAHAKPPPVPKPAPGAPKQPARPSIPKFADTNVVKIRGLKLSPRVPKAGDTVTVTVLVTNESQKPLTKVEWKLSGAVSATGTIASIAAHSTETISKTFTAKAGGISVVAAVDPAQRIPEPSAHLDNNSVTLKTVATAESSAPWVSWVQQASDHSDDFFDLMKAVTSVDGEINGSTLKIKQLKVGTFSTDALKKSLTGSGIPEDVAQAFVDSWVNVYKTWATQYTASVPSAYPGFTAWPGPKAGPMPNVPFPLIAGGGASSKVTVSGIENDLKGRLPAARKKAKEASKAIHIFAESFAGAFDAWLVFQQVRKVMGQGPVPAFAPPYVPVGPVVGGDNIAAPSHLME